MNTVYINTAPVPNLKNIKSPLEKELRTKIMEQDLMLCKNSWLRLLTSQIPVIFQEPIYINLLINPRTFSVTLDLSQIKNKRTKSLIKSYLFEEMEVFYQILQA